MGARRLVVRGARTVRAATLIAALALLASCSPLGVAGDSAVGAAQIAVNVVGLAI
jgi:hypothetical protein